MATKIVISNSPPYFLDLDAPTVPAYETAQGNVKVWRVWCRHCGIWHEHGAGEGNRIAHCDNEAKSFHPGGYNLVYAGQWSEHAHAEGR